MHASVVEAIVSSATTILLAWIAALLRRGIRQLTQLRREHNWLMTSTARNTRHIERIMVRLEMTADD